jgi:pimeloyl-ACP methyl ester carboxylesterase
MTSPLQHGSVRVALALLATLHSGGAGAAEPVAALPLQECRIDDGGASARCGWMTRPENPDKPAGTKVKLRVVVIPSLRLRAEPDPLVILAGGPGQGANDFYTSVSAAFARIRRSRDIVLIDQRGTGQSNRLDCELPDEADFADVDPQQLQVQTRACLGAMSGDPRFYTTSIAVRDLEAIRAALGYPALNLYSVSYGTRVAQHYARRYPSRVRTAILDGAVPADLALGPDAALQAQKALDSLFERCGADAECNKAFPRARMQFDALRERLRSERIQTQIPDPVDAHVEMTRFGSGELSAAVRLLTYTDETASLLPLLIHEAQTLQQPQGLVAQYLMIKRNADTQIAYGMHFSVVCSEDAPRWAQENIDGAALSATFMGQDFMAGMKAICDVWPRGPVDADFNAPFASEAPALILSGSNDPVTPQSYGERAMRSFKHGKHLVLAGQGHGQLANGCMPRVIADFIDQGAAANLDVKCVNAITAAPFMLSRTAPAP